VENCTKYLIFQKEEKNKEKKRKNHGLNVTYGNESLINPKLSFFFLLFNQTKVSSQ
jgi:hypothetical protein